MYIYIIIYIYILSTTVQDDYSSISINQKPSSGHGSVDEMVWIVGPPNLTLSTKLSTKIVRFFSGKIRSLIKSKPHSSWQKKTFFLLVKISIYLRCSWKHLYSCWTNLTLSSELLMLFCFPILADEIQMFVAWFHCFVGEISMAVWSNQHLLLVKCFNANPTQTLGSSWPALVGLARAAPVLAAWCFHGLVSSIYITI